MLGGISIHGIKPIAIGQRLPHSIVVFCANSERFSGHYLLLRLVTPGSTNVHLRRGDTEGVKIKGLPESGSVLHVS